MAAFGRGADSPLNRNQLKSGSANGHKRAFHSNSKLGLKLDCTTPLLLLECNQDKIDCSVTDVAGFVPHAKFDGVHPAH